MSDKYIIRNCPAIYGLAFDGCKKDHYEDGTVLCQDCTDCKLKQIVDNCRNIDCPCEYQGIDCWECSRIGAKTFADSIIRLLDIEEVE